MAHSELMYSNVAHSGILPHCELILGAVTHRVTISPGHPSQRFGRVCQPGRQADEVSQRLGIACQTDLQAGVPSLVEKNLWRPGGLVATLPDLPPASASSSRNEM